MWGVGSIPSAAVTASGVAPDSFAAKHWNALTLRPAVVLAPPHRTGSSESHLAAANTRSPPLCRSYRETPIQPLVDRDPGDLLTQK
jgi:hypothetical protein